MRTGPTKAPRQPPIIGAHSDLDVAQFPQATTYENRLCQNTRWALTQGSQFFEGKSAVQEALRKITARLNELAIPYSVVGGMALFQHGYRRFTEDVDLLVTREDLKRIHENLDGLGWIPPFPKSKNLRDVETGVKIEFLLTGDFPGDGKPKPVAFPDPTSASFEVDGIHYLNLQALIELKLASGMTAPNRMRDLSDVGELIKALDLPLDYAKTLNPFVQEKFGELWKSARRRFMLLWPHTAQTSGSKSLDELIDRLGSSADQLKAMRTDGVFLDPDRATGTDHAHLITTDPKVAQKYAMQEESEFWDDDDIKDAKGSDD
jgi:hypothetical protein